MIKFFVRDISSKGLDIDRTIPMEGIGLSAEEIDLKSPITVKARVERVEDHIVAHAKVTADWGYMCSRCLEDFHEVHEKKYDFDFEITNTQNEEIDLGEEIRQEMILANPSK